MGFSLPTFNLTCNIWRSGVPVAAPPTLAGVICNLARGDRDSVAFPGFTPTLQPIGGMWLLLPFATDIRDTACSPGPDQVEVPAGSGRIYTVGWVDDAGYGFPNAHRFAMILKNGIGPTPWPPASGPPPPPPSGVTQISYDVQTVPAPVMSFLPGDSPGTWLNIRLLILAPLSQTYTITSLNGYSLSPWNVDTHANGVGDFWQVIGFLYYDAIGNDQLTVTSTFGAQIVWEAFKVDNSPGTQIGNTNNSSPIDSTALISSALFPNLLCTLDYVGAGGPLVFPSPFFDAPSGPLLLVSGSSGKNFWQHSGQASGPPYGSHQVLIPYVGLDTWDSMYDVWPP